MNQDRFITGLATSLLLGLGIAMSASAQTPSGMDIINRSIEVVGGVDAISNIRTFHVTGTYDLPALGVSGTIELHYKHPDHLLLTVTFPGIAEVRRGFDGTTAWSIEPQTGARILEGAERVTLLKQAARGFSLLPTATLFSSAEVTETSEFDGEPSYTVVVTPEAGGDTWTEIFSIESGLMIGRIESSASPQGDIEIVHRPSEYRAFGDIKIATVWNNDATIQQWTTTYTEITFDKVDQAVFDLPDEIKALLE